MKRNALIVGLLALGGCQAYPAHPPTCPPGEFQAINPNMMRGDAPKSDMSDSLNTETTSDYSSPPPVTDDSIHEEGM